ncbi:hypothetical protein KAU43_04960 [candidate division WOR-3 bacterium]|nr:hypothetical protein [candidate division WOR-3 bacterium]
MIKVYFKYYIRKILKSCFTYFYLIGIPIYALIFNLFIKTNIVIINSSAIQKNSYLNFQAFSINIISFFTAGYLIGISSSILKDRYIKYERKFLEEVMKIVAIVLIAIVSLIPYIAMYLITLETNKFGYDSNVFILLISILLMILMITSLIGLLANFLSKGFLYFFSWVFYLGSLLLPFMYNYTTKYDIPVIIRGIMSSVIKILPPFLPLLNVIEKSGIVGIYYAVRYTLIIFILIFVYTEGINFVEKKLHISNR